MLRLALMSIVLLTGGCLGIEGTDVSTGAAPSSEGDDGYTTLTATAGDPTSAATTDPATTNPSTDPSDTADDGPVTTTDTQGETTGGGETTDGQPTDSSGEGADDTSESGTSGTGDIDTDGTDTGTESGSSDSGSESTGDTCGDGEVQPLELCDGEDLQGFDCQSLRFLDGVLACDPVTCVFDVSQCGQ